MLEGLVADEPMATAAAAAAGAALAASDVGLWDAAAGSTAEMPRFGEEAEELYKVGHRYSTTTEDPAVAGRVWEVIREQKTNGDSRCDTPEWSARILTGADAAKYAPKVAKSGNKDRRRVAFTETVM
eukprot:CAMPEP_0172809720 /NCGR_PEP_ID=MMETSP1075-20121228/8384_1 /TAXON_ID=2916 /ORGANISM="Ceratium fusus, Strain PA161109" /LENGTH=126 /DNA_ID=CAMNT_0013648959 /DNA_START=6 /DNA_END=386 /DNA_ORIENTATION=+